MAKRKSTNNDLQNILRMLLMDYVILCGSNRSKAIKSVICASNSFNKTFEEAKGGNHMS
jgi:hypothetical protein